MPTAPVYAEAKRIVIAIDPAVTATTSSDETGIVVCARGIDDNGYVLDDLSGKFSPERWARLAVDIYWELQADRIVAEVNNGGDMVEAVLRMIDREVSYRAVHASRGKRIRAEPIVAMYEKGRIFHARPFPQLEEEMCLAGDTAVITRDGAVPIKELVNRTCQVLGKDGAWHLAHGHCYGLQPLARLVVSRYGYEIDLRATPAHRWFVDATPEHLKFQARYLVERHTRDLTSGDLLYGITRRNLLQNTSRDPVGIMAGFVYGDGWRATSGGGSGVAFFPEDEAIRAIYEGCGYRPILKQKGQGGPHWRLTQLPKFMNHDPDVREASSYLYGWLAGYFAADSSVTSTQFALNAADRHRLEVARHVCVLLGIATGPIVDKGVVTRRLPHGGEYAGQMYCMSLLPGALHRDFFLHERHRVLWESVSMRRQPRIRWRVESITPEGEDLVYCMRVPQHECFVLADTNIVSGNCTWDPISGARSPSRLDAMVWGFTDLFLGARAGRVALV